MRNVEKRKDGERWKLMASSSSPSESVTFFFRYKFFSIHNKVLYLKYETFSIVTFCVNLYLNEKSILFVNYPLIYI